MRFPKLTVDLVQYYADLKRLTLDETCHIFLDTNIISQMYRLNTAARTEFYTWLDAMHRENRVHVPNWAIHEYSNRFLSEKTSDYLGELDILKKLPKTMEQVSNFLKMYLDESTIQPGSSYAGHKNQLFEDFDNAILKIESIKKALDRNKTERLKQTVHQEMVTKFQNFSMNVDVYKLLRNVGSHQKIRYESKMPPGFKDDYKEYNSAGDLLLWQEILSFCSKSTPIIGKAILVTRDMKSDFVYRPHNYIESGIEKSNQQIIKIADERLVYEFKTKTNSEEFYIINFEQLIKILSSICPTSYRELSIAVQIDPEVMNVNGIEDISEDEDDSAPIVDNPEQVSTSTPQAAEVAISEPTTEVSYSLHALADKDFVITEHEELHRIIKRLKSHTWTIQNNGISDFNTYLSEPRSENNIPNADSLFVLGRNIYQSACGNAFYAISFIENINEKLSHLESFAAKALLDGCLYEVYFNSFNNYRSNGCKGDYIAPLRECLRVREYRESLDFITSQLEQLPPEDVYFTPLHSDTINVELMGERVTNPDDVEMLNVSQVKINGREIDYRSYLYNFFSAMTINIFKNRFSRVFAVSEDLIAIEDVSPNCVINFTHD